MIIVDGGDVTAVVVAVVGKLVVMIVVIFLW